MKNQKYVSYKEFIYFKHLLKIA